MKRQLWKLSIVLLACATWCASVSCPVAAEEVSCSFDFDDGKIPDSLSILKIPFYDELTETLTCGASMGELRIYDTVSASCGLYLHPTEVLTDSHLSAVMDPEAGNGALWARSTGTAFYGCWLWRSPTSDAIQMWVGKTVDDVSINSSTTGLITAPGPFLVEFDVYDGEAAGQEYTQLAAQLTYDNGQRTKRVLWTDFGTTGGDRLLSGQAGFGALLGPNQRDAANVLNVTIDDVTIRGTLVPEPSVVLLGFLGAAFLPWQRRK